MTLRGWNENATSSEWVPIGAPRYVEPIAQAASSMTAMPSGSQSSWMPFDVGRGAALVDEDHGLGLRGERRFDGRAGQALRAAARRRRTPDSHLHIAPTFAVAMNESDGTMTSSPRSMPASTRARCSAVVHDDVATASGAPTPRRERLFEAGDPGALRDPARRHRVRGGLRLLGPECRLHHRDPALDSSVGLLVVVMLRSPLLLSGDAAAGGTAASAAARSDRHQLTSRRRPSSSCTSGSKPSTRARPAEIGDAPRHRDSRRAPGRTRARGHCP